MNENNGQIQPHPLAPVTPNTFHLSRNVHRKGELESKNHFSNNSS